MGRPATVVPEILRLLEPYLEARLAEYEARPEPREPTLPATPDGKVNVRALTLALGLKVTQEQHFHKSPELKRIVNAAAEAQGLAPIGSRAQMNADDAVVMAKLGRARAEASDYAKALAEREAVIQQQRRYIASLEEQLRIRDETGMILRTAPIR
ncbi:MAG: hypothetical protein RLY86_2717 [Pseudomonadota bacterium]|jgi:hypothetical protein